MNMSDTQQHPPVQESTKTGADSADTGNSATRKSGRGKIKHFGHHSHKWFKRFFWVLAIIPAILFSGFWGAMQFIDFNRYKPQLEQEFLQKTGYAMKIHGTIDVSVIPFVMTLTQVDIKNTPDFKEPNLASMEAIEVEMSLWDLFINRKVDIQGLELEKLVVNLVTNKEGKHNWTLLEKLVKREAIPQFKKVVYHPVRNPSESKSIRLLGDDWFLRTLVSQNAEIHWQNNLNGHRFVLSDFDLMAFDVGSKHSFNVMTNFDYTNTSFSTQFHVKLSSEMKISDRFHHWLLQNWQGIVQLSMPDQLNIPDVSMQTEGKLFDLNLRKSLLAVESGQLNSSKGKAIFDFTQSFGKEAYSKGHWASDRIDVRKWFRHAGVDLPKFVNGWVLSDVSLVFDWMEDDSELAVENIKMDWDESQLTGKFLKKMSISSNTSQPIHFNFKIDQINLDNYQAIAESGAIRRSGDELDLQVKKPDEGMPAKESELTETYLPLALPIDFLQKLSAEGPLEISRLKAWGMHFENVSTTLLAQKGELNFAPLNAGLYQGALTSRLRLNVNGKTPRYHWAGSTDSIQLEPFLKDGWQYEQLKGRFSSDFDLETTGVSGKLLKQNLEGVFSSEIAKGAFVGTDLNKLLGGQTASQKDETLFDSISLKGKTQNGNYDVQRFNVKSDRFTAIGKGRLKLDTANLNGQLFAIYQRPPDSLSYLKGLEVPIQLSGDIPDLKWQVNVDKLMQNAKNQQKALKSIQKLLQK